MPSVKSQLSAAEIAAVAEVVSSNAGKELCPEEVSDT